MSDFLRYTKMVSDAFVEVNGNLKMDTSSQIGRRKLSDRAMNFLKEYIKFVKESGLLSEPSMIYLESVEHNQMDAIRTYNATSGAYKQISARKAYNSFYYDTKKLTQFFPDDMLKNVIFTKCNIEVYEATLQAAINKRMGKSFLGKMTILKLPSTVCQEKPSDNELDMFFSLFEPYTKESIEQVEKMIPKNVVGYINYIASKREQTVEEKAILNRVKLAKDDVVIE